MDTLVDEVFAQVDVDCNGSISLEEWRAAWESAAACRGAKGRPLLPLRPMRLDRASCALGSQQLGNFTARPPERAPPFHAMPLLTKTGNPEIAAMTGVEGLLSILLPQGQGERQIDGRHPAGGGGAATAMSGALRDTAAK